MRRNFVSNLTVGLFHALKATVVEIPIPIDTNLLHLGLPEFRMHVAVTKTYIMIYKTNIYAYAVRRFVRNL